MDKLEDGNIWIKEKDLEEGKGPLGRKLGKSTNDAAVQKNTSLGVFSFAKDTRYSHMDKFYMNDADPYPSSPVMGVQQTQRCDDSVEKHQ